jgi:hypothetical protein
MNKPELPPLNEDGSWDFHLGNVKYRMREARLKERSQARRQAQEDQEVDASIGEGARLMSIVLLRENKDGKHEEVSYEEIMNRGESVLAQLNQQYLLGLAAISEKNRNLSSPLKSETSPALKSASSVRP